ncbi:MAG: DsbE family thiol:disulfide interchange protein [Hyphomicrobiaceae bacterium]
MNDPAQTALPGEMPPRRRLWPVLAPVVIFTVVACLFLIALQKGDPSKLPSALIGRPAPQVDLAPIPGLERDGAPVPGFNTGEIGHGKPAVVNFFASWCVPCADEHPQLVALVKRTGVTLIGINNKDQPANAIRFLRLHGNPYASVGSDANGRAAIEWGVYGMPETFIVDANGTVVFKQVGPISPEILQQKILPALEQAGMRRID